MTTPRLITVREVISMIPDEWKDAELRIQVSMETRPMPVACLSLVENIGGKRVVIIENQTLQ